jgi:hypothetical protein
MSVDFNWTRLGYDLVNVILTFSVEVLILETTDGQGEGKKC